MSKYSGVLALISSIGIALSGCGDTGSTGDLASDAQPESLAPNGEIATDSQISADLADVQHSDTQVFDNTNRQLLRDSDNSATIEKTWGTDVDNSGTVHIRVYDCSGSGQHPEVHCSVDPDEVLVGGGAWADYGGGAGALLTGSFPENNNLETWVARSKDHYYANFHTLHSYAVGMTLDGVDRSTLLNYMSYRTLTSGSDAHPGVSLGLPAGYVLIGGGARSNYTGSGNMLTESYPTNSTTWRVGSKDHQFFDPTTITAYAIGITTGAIPGFGSLDVQQRSSSSYASTGIATATKNPTSGWATTCAAGRSQYNSAGRMLFSMMPTEDDSIQASSKDHRTADSGTTYAYSLEIRKH